MGRLYNIYDNSVDILTLGFGIDNIKEVLGVVLLCLSIFNMTLKTVFKIIDKVKNKKYSEITQDLDELENDIENKIKEKGD